MGSKPDAWMHTYLGENITQSTQIAIAGSFTTGPAPSIAVIDDEAREALKAAIEACRFFESTEKHIAALSRLAGKE